MTRTRDRPAGATRTDAAPRWCDELPTVTAEVPCGAERHRIVWHRAKVVLADHDLLAERLLTSLGSEPPLCVEVLDAWLLLRGPGLLHEFLVRSGEAPVEDLAARRIEHRQAIDRTRGIVAGPAQVLRGLLPGAPGLIEREKRAWAMTLLEALPVDFRRMLVLAMIVEIDRRWHDAGFREAHREHVEPVLDATAAKLVERSARRARVGLKPHARFAIESCVLARGEPAACTMRIDDHGGEGRISLPLSWFTDLWSRGLAFVDDCFVLGRAGYAVDPARVPVRAVRWERDGPSASKAVPAWAVVTRRDDGEGWSLSWL